MGNFRKTRRAALLACASLATVAGFTVPSHAEQQVFQFFINGHTTGCCSSFHGKVWDYEHHGSATGTNHITFNTTSSATGALSEASSIGIGTKGHHQSTVHGSTQNDAYDGFGSLQAHPNPQGSGGYALNFNGLSVTRDVEVTHGPSDASTAITTPFTAAGVPNAVRFFDSFTNNTGAAITITASYETNLGSDSNTKFYTVGANNTFLTSGQAPSGGPNSSDPVDTVVFGNNAYTKNTVILHYANGDDNPEYLYPITVNPGQTVSVLWFSILTADMLRGTGVDANSDGIDDYYASDITLGQSMANLITNNGHLSSTSAFLTGLSASQIASIINFDTAPPNIDTSQAFFTEADGAAQASPATFDGGTLKPTTALTWTQNFTILSTGGTIDDTNGNQTFSGVISGAGGLTIKGAKFTILTGTDTYTGGTTISSGATLQIGSGGTAGAITGNVADSGTLTFNRSDSVTFAGVISGTGAVTQAGSGTLILTGANTYTGVTTIASGSKLQVGSAGTSGAIAGNVADSGTLTFNRTDSLTYAGVISGTGAVTQAGTGTTILTGANTYTGATTIAAGTLQIGGGGTTGSIAGNVTDNATLAFNRTDSITYAGVISGTGAVKQAGTGTTVLTGANTYSGGTTITAGTLQIGSGGTAGSISGNVADSGALAFNRTDAITFSGVVSGTGGLTQAGTGTVALTGANTYTGTTLISAGVLQIGGGSTTGSIAGNVTDNGVLAFMHSDAITFAGVISGTGGVAQAGTGTTTLSGTSTYTGGTLVSGGTLNVTGAIGSSAVVVNSGATLTGTGTVGATTVQSGAKISPAGTAVGTLAVKGNLTLQAGGTYVDDITPTTTDLITATGTATVGGGVTVNIGSGTYTVGQTIKIVTSTGALSGTFSGMTLNGTFASTIRPIFGYDGNDAFVLLAPNAVSPSLAAGSATNLINVAAAVDSILQGNTSNSAAFAPLFNLTQAQLTDTLNQLAGEVSTGSENAGIQISSQFLALMLNPYIDARGGVAGAGGPGLAFAPQRVAGIHARLDQLRAPRPSQPGDPMFSASLGSDPSTGMGAASAGGPLGVWMSAFGERTTANGIAASGSHNTVSSQAGFAGGFDYRPVEGIVMGVAGGSANVTWHIAGGLGQGRAKVQQGGFYGSAILGDDAYASLAFNIGNYDVTTIRNVVLSGTNTYSAAYTATNTGIRVEAGDRLWRDGNMTFTPYGVITANHFRTPAYQEKTVAGSTAFALNVAKNFRDEAITEFGLKFDTLADPASQLNLHSSLGWQHDFNADGNLQTATFAGQGLAFTVRGAPSPADALTAGLGADAMIADGLAIGLKVNTVYSGRTFGYGGTGAIEYRW